MAAYLIYRRPIGLIREGALATIFVVIIGVFAFKRIDADRIIDPSLIDILIPGEFISIYGNAIHWASMLGTQDFVAPPSSSYLQSLIAFVPKQFNAEKWDLADWYVTQYFPEYAAAGGGLAFGIIPEAMVNWGLFSVVFQAFIVAFIFRAAYFSAYANRARGANVWVVFYLFSFASIYQVIRSNSFSIISGMVLGFAVPFLILLVLSKFRLTLMRSTDA
jgi:oligosaccharide repeat unit polymerase